MALRELLAVFDVQVNDQQLRDADRQLDQYESALAGAVASMSTLQVPDLGLGGLVPEDIVPNVDTDAVIQQLQTLQGEAQEASARLSAELLINPELRTEETDQRLLQLQAQAESAGARLREASRVDTDAAAQQLEQLQAQVEQLAAGPADAAALEQIQTEAAEVEARLRRAASVDASNPELPQLQQQLNKVSGAANRAEKELKETGNASEKTAGKMSKLTGVLGTLGAAFGIHQVFQFGQNILQTADEAGKLAAQLGLTTDELQTWDAFAQTSGATAEELRISMKSLTKNMQTISDTGAGPAADTFKKLGIEVENTDGTLRSATDVMLETGGRLAELENGATRVALAQTVLGEASLKLLPGFKGGTQAAREQFEALKDVAIVYDEEFIKQTEAANDAMFIAGLQFKRAGASLLSALLPAIKGVSDVLTPLLKDLDGATVSTGLFSAALVALGPSLVSTKLGLAGIGTVAKTGARWVGRFLLPFLILEDIFGFLQGKDSVIGDILDAIFGAGAAQAVVEGLSEAWHGVTGAVRILVGVFTGDLMGAFNSLTDEQKAGLEAWGAAWDVFKNMVLGVWDSIVQKVSDAFSSIGGFFSKLFGGDEQGALEVPVRAVPVGGGPSLEGFDQALGMSEGPPIGALFNASVPVDGGGMSQTNTFTQPINLQQTFNNTGMPASPEQAGQTMAAGVGQVLERGNKQTLKAIGAN